MMEYRDKMEVMVVVVVVGVKEKEMRIEERKKISGKKGVSKRKGGEGGGVT